MRTPIALIIFNRPDLTERVLQQIAVTKPKTLFVIADGPRQNRPEDISKCQAARSVIDRVNWDCEVVKNYSETNLGCGHRPASGISWVFENVDRAIILEDDVIPHPSFFRFCDGLLERYADDTRVMQICGHNYQKGQKRGLSSYYFSRHSICAGAWATWRRAWKHFDFHMSLWPILRETTFLLDVLGDAALLDKWKNLLDVAHSGRPTSRDSDVTDYWDFQWNFAIWAQSGLAIFPNQILVSNVGYRSDATHTKSANQWANLPAKEMAFPLVHPHCVIRNREADQFFVELEKASLRPSLKTAPLLVTRLAIRLWSLCSRSIN